MFLIITGELCVISLLTSTQIIEPFSLSKIVEIIGGQIGYILEIDKASPILLFLIGLLLIPSYYVMKIFGAKKDFSKKRLLKWYLLAGPIISAIVMQLIAAEKVPMKSFAGFISQLPILNISVFAIFAGVFLVRKSKHDSQMIEASNYRSNGLIA